MNNSELAKKITDALIALQQKAGDGSYGEPKFIAIEPVIEEVLESARPEAGAPEGWQLVPMEPTVDMLANCIEHLSVTPGQANGITAEEVWRAMLDVAPTYTRRT